MGKLSEGASAARSLSWVMTFVASVALGLAPVGCGGDDKEEAGSSDAGAGGTAGAPAGSGGSSGDVGSGDAGEGGEPSLGGAGGGGHMHGAGGEGGGMAMVFHDLSLELTKMTPHKGQRLELRVVNEANKILSVGVVESVGGDTLNLVLPKSVLAGTKSRLDFFADFNESGGYDVPPTDHAWTLPIPAGDAPELAFEHVAKFDDIEDPAVTTFGEDFEIEFTGMTPHVGQAFQLRVLHDAGAHVVLWYSSVLTEADFKIAVPGIVAEGGEYQVDFIVDHNKNEKWDAPPKDHAWRLNGKATGDGLKLEFAHNTDFTDVKF